MQNTEKLHNTRHSLAHLLAAAILEMYPDTKNTIGPAIDDGFYYDFEFSAPISDKELPKIEKKMREILKTWKGFESAEKSADEARTHFAHNPYKVELINDIETKGEKINAKSKFVIKLKDYKISIPKAVADKISENMEITVDVNLDKINK